MSVGGCPFPFYMLSSLGVSSRGVPGAPMGEAFPRPHPTQSQSPRTLRGGRRYRFCSMPQIPIKNLLGARHCGKGWSKGQCSSTAWCAPSVGAGRPLMVSGEAGLAESSMCGRCSWGHLTLPAASEAVQANSTTDKDWVIGRQTPGAVSPSSLLSPAKVPPRAAQAPGVKHTCTQLGGGMI